MLLEPADVALEVSCQSVSRWEDEVVGQDARELVQAVFDCSVVVSRNSPGRSPHSLIRHSVHTVGRALWRQGGKPRRERGDRAARPDTEGLICVNSCWEEVRLRVDVIHEEVVTVKDRLLRYWRERERGRGHWQGRRGHRKRCSANRIRRGCRWERRRINALI